MILMPHRKSLPLVWRRIPERYRMIGTKCSACGTMYFPKRYVCTRCRRKGRMEEKQLKGNGEVYSYTVVHVPPDGFEYSAPYVLAIIKLDEGPMITGQITDIDPQEAKIGLRVKSVFRRITEDGEDGIIHYAFKFVPAK